MSELRCRRGCLPRSNRTRSRTGYTLRELLVVMGLLAIGFGLAMPSVEKSRTVAQQDACRNRMRNLALAMMQYDTQQQQLPGWANVVCPDAASGNAVPGQSRPASWCFELLPYLDKANLHQEYGAGDPRSDGDPRRCLQQGPPSEYLPEFVCHADPRHRSGSNVLSYIANCGLRDRGFMSTSIGRPGDEGAAYLDALREPTANGVFHNNYFRSESQLRHGGAHYTVNTLTLISAGDGTSSTLMFSENLDATHWPGGSQPSKLDLTEGTVCFCWTAIAPDQAATSPNNMMRINAGVGTAPGRAPRPSSRHPGGVNVVFCDAHSAFIHDDIDWFTWCLLHTPGGAGNRFLGGLRAPTEADFQDHPAVSRFRHVPPGEKF